MNIAFILATFPSDYGKPHGGVETATINLINGLNSLLNKAIKFTVILPGNDRVITRLPDNLKIIFIKTNLKPAYYNLPIVGIRNKIEDAVNSIKPDVIHVQGVPAFFNPNRKTILTIHGIPFIDSSLNKVSLTQNLRSYILKKIFYNSVNKYSDINIISTYLYNTILRGRIEEKKFHYLPNSIVSKNISFVEKQDKKLILFVSAIIRPLKNIETVLKIGVGLKKAGIEFEIRLAGDFINNVYEDKIINDIKDLNIEENIKLLGYLNQEDLRKQLQLVHLNLLMSFQEVCPMSILEAQTFAVPSITSFVGGIPDLIINGFNGFMFHPTDHINSSKEIINLWKNKTKLATISANCLKVSKEYNNINIARKYYSLYKSIIYDQN